LGFTGLAAFYASTYGFKDHVEANICAVSWLVHTGHPIYHALSSAERYSFEYGPLLYLAHAGMFALLGPSLLSTKVMSVAAAMLSIGAVAVVGRRVIGLRDAITLTWYCAVAMVLLDLVALQNRADPLLLLCTSLGLIGILFGGRASAVVMCALTLGVATNLKAHAPLYFLPLLTALYSRYGFRATVICIVGAVAVAVAPFLHPQVSLANYAAWLTQTARHGLDVREAMSNTYNLAALTMPIWVGMIQLHNTHPEGLKSLLATEKRFVEALVVSLVIMFPLASKIGNGPHHFLPYMPLFAYLLALVVAEIRKSPVRVPNAPHAPMALLIIGLTWFVVCSTMATVKENRWYADLNARPGKEVVADIRDVLAHHPDETVGMGCGEGRDNDLTFYRAEVLFVGNPCLVDEAALMDMQQSGLKLPEQTLEALRDGMIRLWLIPKGNRPFAMRSGYKCRDLFGHKFRRIFLERYGLQSNSRYFDLWAYRDGQRAQMQPWGDIRHRVHRHLFRRSDEIPARNVERVGDSVRDFIHRHCR
jgi:hypothetical protein